MFLLQAGNAVAMRQNSSFVKITFSIIIIVVVAIILYFVFKRITKNIKILVNHRVINYKSLQSAGTKLELKKDEINFLYIQCKKNNIIELPLISDTELCIDREFKAIYNGLKKETKKFDSDEFENLLSFFFNIIQKIEYGKQKLGLITNTITFTDGLDISYVDENNTFYASKIIKNTENALILDVPKNEIGEQIRPPALSKITLYIELPSGSAYKFTSRVIRYQTGHFGEEMAIGHTRNIEFFQRRQYKRIKSDIACSFTVCVPTQIKGKLSLKKTNAKFNGNITDISIKGCRIKTTAPLQIKQYVIIDTMFITDFADQIIGSIVNVWKNPSTQKNIFNVKFEKIAKKSQNNIFKLIYKFEKTNDIEKPETKKEEH